MTTPRRPLLATVLAWLAGLAAAVSGVGFALHTDFDPTVFGKYATVYFLFLLAWWLLFVPASFIFVRWVLTTQTIDLPSGRVLTWRPSAKALLVLVVGALLWLGFLSRVDKAMGRGVATPMQSDAFHPFLQNAPVAWHRRLGTNAHGFRGGPIERAKPKGVYRIVLFGGSTLFAAALPLEQSPGERMLARLRHAESGRTVEVQNAAAEWHTTQHSLVKLLTWVQDFDPDLVVVYHAINDLYRSFSPHAFAVGDYRSDYGHFHGSVSRLVRPGEVTPELLRMRLGYWFSDLRYERVRVRGPQGEGVKGARLLFFPRAEPVEIVDWKSLPAFERNLSDFVEIADAKGIEVIVASQPSLYTADMSQAEREVSWIPRAHQQGGTRPSFASMAEGMRRYNAVSRRVAAAHGATFVDLAAAVPQDLEHLYDDVHYTEAGSRVVGETLAEAVLEAGLLDP